MAAVIAPSALASERRALRGVPIRDVLALPAMAQARLVAGAGGLDRVVRSVNVMEVPDILEWVQPDELLLTTAYPLRDDRLALAQLVPRLADRGLAGMAIKPTRYIGSIPPVMADEAERLDFPLIELPPPASFNEVIGAVLGVILDVQSVRLRRAAEIHDRFTNIVLSGGGLRQIAEALAEAIGLPVAILDAQAALLAQSPGFDGALLDDLDWKPARPRSWPDAKSLSRRSGWGPSGTARSSPWEHRRAWVTTSWRRSITRRPWPPSASSRRVPSPRPTVDFRPSAWKSW
jgi:purine catabolism regulatory family protein